MAKGGSISIKKPKGKLPSLPFLLLKDMILGKNYELSIVFADARTSRNLNYRFRGKDKPTNILSFPLSQKSGELVVHLPAVKRDAASFGRTYENFLGFLLIHGMLHLKGMRHGSKMEGKERQYCRFFQF